MKDTPEKPVSLADIAKVANVSRMTVSLALRNDPAIREQTRENVARIAKELGYTPDARMAQRMQNVRATKDRKLIPLAWIDQNLDKGLWHRNRHSSPYLDGAREQCEKMGYVLQEFWLKEKGMSDKRLSQILYNRGINGLIIAPPSTRFMTRLDLKWDHFAAVTFGKSLALPRLHSVCQDNYYNMILALTLLRRFGYRRIGVILQAQSNRRSHHAQQAAVHYFQFNLPKAEQIPPIEHDYKMIASAENDYAHVAGQEFPKWLRKHRPDVIVGQDNRIPDWLKAEGYRVPEDIGVVHLSLDDDCLDWAGIHSQKKQIGAATANMLINLVQNHQFGLPDTPMETIIPGIAQPGKTLLVPKPV